MRKVCGRVGWWGCMLALVGASAGCSGRTEVGAGRDEGGGGEGLSAPDAGNGGHSPSGEAGAPEGGSSGSSAGTSAAGGGALIGGTGGDPGSGGTGGADAGGTPSGGTDAGGTPSGGTDAGGTPSGGTDAGGTGAQAGSAGTGSAGGPPDLTSVKPSAGCGLAAPSDLVVQQYVGRTIETSGHKENSSTPQRCRPGLPATYDWSYTREYSVRLPSGYDPAKAYPLLLQGNCNPNNVVPPVPDIAEQVIHVYFVPRLDCPGGQQCYDNADGDNSSEFPFYEGVRQRLADELCFDQNRVFATGWFGAGSWANELGCVYAGHANYPIRAIGVGLSGLYEPTPTCSGSPLAGLWIQTKNQYHEYKNVIAAGMTAALLGNGCQTNGAYTDYAVPGLDPFTCHNYAGSCPASASNPVVECFYSSPDPGKGYTAATVANLGLAHFFGSFFAP